ncbi:hypothetical protein [Sphaerisporangium sp. NPDC051011]|uniref:hypothetical protein n=1 Tax=Sphaerisporangium sp. NPDC051011 TaxID=3155792 RepID=UPI0033FE8D7B
MSEIRFGSKERDCLYSLASSSPLVDIESAPKRVFLSTTAVPITAYLTEAGLPESAGPAEERFPGIARLLSIVADYCRGPNMAESPDEEDLLDCFDRFTVGGLNWDIDDPWWER